MTSIGCLALPFFILILDTSLFWKKIDRKKRFHIIDPDDGRVTLSQDEIVEKMFINESIICILVEPDDTFKTKNPDADKTKKHPLRNLTWRIFCQHKKHFSIISALTLLAMAITWIMPLLFRKTIDDGILNKDIPLIWLLLISQLLFNVGFVITNSISKVILLKTGFSFGTNLIEIQSMRQLWGCLMLKSIILRRSG